MLKPLLAVLLALAVLPGCTRPREVENDLRIVDVRTGWYDAGIENGMNKLVPSVTLRLENVSDREIASVQLNAIFRRVGEVEVWGEHFLRAIDSDGLDPGATGEPLMIRSNLGYTGQESRQQMLMNSQFVDARVEIFGKHGSRAWVKMGEFDVDRQLITQ